MREVKVSREIVEEQLKIAEEYREKSPKGRKFYMECYGCQQNEADSERMSGLCGLMGYEKTDDKTEASLIIINTCAIREHAELKALSNTGQLKRLKEKDPSLLIGLCGCMAQEKHRREQLKKSYPYVDFLLGTDMIHMLPSVIEKAAYGKKRVWAVNDLPHNELGVIAEGLPVMRESKVAGWVSVMYGCNNFCSYCIVPYVRGRERSRNEEDVIREVRELLDSGVKDITLLGQNVNSYKSDNGVDFPTLLEHITALDGDFRIRFMTSHPKDCTKRLAETFKNEKMANHFHLPFQSGSSRILELMNRRYDKEKYLEKAMMLKETIPNVALTTDIIIGFPTETEKDFLDTVDVVKKVGFDMSYIFLYSPRVGTRAAVMDDQIPHEVKVERFKYLSDVQNEIARANNEKLLGSVQRVLVDGVENGIYTGRSGQNKIVNFSGENIAVGDFCNVEITECLAYSISGKKIK